jgi:hypothetical protein
MTASEVLSFLFYIFLESDCRSAFSMHGLASPVHLLMEHGIQDAYRVMMLRLDNEYKYDATNFVRAVNCTNNIITASHLTSMPSKQ